MFRSLVDEARIWSVVWRRRLAIRSFAGPKETLGFLAMLAVPTIAVGSIVYFAYVERMRMPLEVARLEAARKRALDLRCLAENVYFEARGEPLKGQYAIAEVTLNRLHSPYFPNTICEVVHDTRWDPARRRLVAHFSWTGHEQQAAPTGPAWKRAMTVATAVYDHQNMPVMPPDALFYHATSIRPYWAATKKVIARIGDHIFYR